MKSKKVNIVHSEKTEKSAKTKAAAFIKGSQMLAEKDSEAKVSEHVSPREKSRSSAYSHLNSVDEQLPNSPVTEGESSQRSSAYKELGDRKGSDSQQMSLLSPQKRKLLSFSKFVVLPTSKPAGSNCHTTREGASGQQIGPTQGD